MSNAPAVERAPLQAVRRRLLVMMPALNEAMTIQQVIARIPREIDGIDEISILVVDDGSTDDTVRLAREAGADVVSHGRNRGVGAAMQTGLDEAIRRGVDFAINIDSDGQFRPEDIPTLLEPVKSGQADFATASRFADPKLVPEMPAVKRFGNWGMSLLISTIVGKRFHDVSCGFRCYSRECMLNLMLTGAFTYTQESFLVISGKGMKMVEVPLTVRGVREHGQSRVASNLWNYARRTSSIIYTWVRDYAPGMVFNTVSALFALVAMGLATFFFWHYFATGSFSPHLWAGFLSAFFFGLGAMTFALGQVAVMISRLRQLQEKQLYLLRKHLERVDSR